jgi:hypothetical protein
MMPGLSVTQAAGILLVAGAAIFWSIIVAAIVTTVRTGSLPFKDSSAVPAREFYESIDAKPRWWLAVNLTFSTGIIVTAMGLTLLRSLLREAGDAVFAELGLVVFVIAATLWLVQMVFNLSMATWAADESGRTHSVPPAAEAWPRGLEQFVHTYMVLAYVATALFGAGIVASGLLDASAGWIAVVAGIAGAASVILTGPQLAIPLLIHVVPATLGVLLLLQPG